MKPRLSTCTSDFYVDIQIKFIGKMEMEVDSTETLTLMLQLASMATKFVGLDGNLVSWLSYASRWWQDVSSLEVLVGQNWFNRDVTRIMNTSFWNDFWVGNTSLRMLFPGYILYHKER